ncbi:MAG TPA: serine/threonine-protein kinase [Polyangiaceae bacterium]|nr:serine/threonine-protein kinase [Polyangiaceae bacterium]
MPGVGELIAGKYRIEGSLGVGGMGVVLAARHDAIGQLFAIKFLVVGDEEYRAEATVRLLREARAAASLRGEHVVQVFDVGELANGTPFIVMERLDGHDLGVILRRVGSLPIPLALALMVQACHAVGEAHRAGIVHRDLKPSNLFVVRRSDGQAWLKVVDFGISKSMRPDPVEPRTLTGAKIALGSPRYMSPEQVRDARAVDGRSDVWSLGVILFEMLTGRPAFQAASYSGIYAAIVADPPPSLALVCPEASPELSDVLTRCLTRDPDARLQSVDELRALIEPFAAPTVDFAALLAVDPARVRVESEASRSGSQLVSPFTERSPHDLPATERAAGVPERTHSATRTQVSAGAPSSSGAVAVSAAALSQRSPASSSEPRTRRSASDDLSPAAPSPAFRRGWLVLGLLVPLALLLLWVLRPSPATAPPAPPTVARGVQLTVESEPPGARVAEGNTVYGVTPLQLSLSFSGDAAKPRVFVLELSGYRPYVVEQGPSSGPARVHAVLVPEPAQERAAAPSGAASAVVTNAPRPPVRPAPSHSAAPATSAEPAWDIRLSR